MAVNSWRSGSGRKSVWRNEALILRSRAQYGVSKDGRDSLPFRTRCIFSRARNAGEVG
jgi:hypothetical protein